MMTDPITTNNNGSTDILGGPHARTSIPCFLWRVAMNKWLLAAILAAAAVFMYVSILVTMSG